MWLLEQSVFSAIEHAFLTGYTPTAEQHAEFSAARPGENGPLTIAGSVAEILVEGVLTPRADIFAYLFGGGNTTYADVQKAIRAAESDPNVREIVYRFASPGGSISGLFETLATMQEVRKPTRAVVTSAASAAYAMASQADQIEATSKASSVGSIGIVATFRTREDVVEVTSTNAPNKRPDVKTEEGQAVVREELDAYHELFVEAIAGGRGTTAAKVNAEFGRGGMYLASEALKRGMIDSIGASGRPTTATASGGNKPESKTMDLAQLQAQHPDVYAAAVKVGTDAERKRAAAHLKLGQASGAMEFAIKAVREGAELDMEAQAEYMAAGMNKNDRDNRQGDDAGAEGALKGADSGADATDVEDEVADKVAAMLGYKGE